MGIGENDMTPETSSKGFSLRNFKLSAKITAAFLIISAIVCIVGGIGIWALGQVDTQGKDLSTGAMVGLQQTTSILNDFHLVERDTANAVLVPDASQTQQLVTQTQADLKLLQSDFTAYDQSPFSPDEQVLIAQYQPAFAAWNQTLQTILPLASENTVSSNNQAGVILATKWESQSATLDKIVQGLVGYQVQQGNADSQNISRTYTQMVWVLGLCMVFAVGIAMFLGRFISNMVVKPLRTCVTVVQKMAQGELSEITSLVKRYGGQDATGELVFALAETLGKLRGLIGNVTKMSVTMAEASAQIAEAAKQTDSATGQVSQAIEQVATGAQEQSSQLSQATSEVEQLAHHSQAMQQNADITMQAMITLKETIESTAQQVSTLGTRSEEIGQIVQTINEIAEQTNLLALNAAIEAARAGDQGRGFAVVADEVRKLAERSAEATKQIRQMITDIQVETVKAVQSMQSGVMHVEEGASRVEETNHAAKMMTDSVHRVDAAMTSVASVSEENSAAAEEVSAATEQMTAQVSEVVSAIEGIKAIAENLHEAAQVFHWTYEDNWRARGMVPSDTPLPWHPIPADGNEDTPYKPEQRAA
jgi:methyl-accepting chemotaxis protein